MKTVWTASFLLLFAAVVLQAGSQEPVPESTTDRIDYSEPQEYRQPENGTENKEEPSEIQTPVENESGDREETLEEEPERESTARIIHQEINEEREKRSLEPLEYSEELEDIAREHSRDMAERDYFSHRSPEGESFQDRYREAGYRCGVRQGHVIYRGAENIAYRYSSVEQPKEEVAEAIVRQWMNSPGHRRNILQPYWNEEGVGIDRKNGRVYATQNFC